MGKVLIVGIFVISAIFIIIILSVQGETSDSREGISRNLTEIQAKQLCREALNYGIKRVKDAGSSATLPTYTQTFVDFEIGDGIIDRIEYTAIGDTMKISSYASYQNGNNTFQHKSTAFVTWDSSYGAAAITANGYIDVGGNADVESTIPNVNPALDFEDFFGITKAEMRAIADIVYNHDMVDPPNNPGGISDVTYVSFTNPNGILKVTQSSWSGSGLLVVDGNCSITGGYFSGVLWVTGNLFIRGNDGFEGAIYNEGINSSGGSTLEVDVLGTSIIHYNPASIDSAFALIGQPYITSSKLKVISMFEDD